MAMNLETLSPKELQALISTAQSQMQAARANQVQAVRSKIDALLHSSGLTLADVYPTRGGKAGKGGKKSSVAPKYRNPANPAQTWSGRGKRPLWFVDALKRRGVTAESLLISPAAQAPAPAKAAKTARKATKKVVRKAGRKSTAKKAAKR
ncbi:H-NS histone family protein [Dyella subtropica]|uniref:H-NS histone family protein n=1 Tax=Dyella subtropica TaxID=2992127 RepID=UPI00225ADED3|nr:H-NS histone family protein [Dyella subtropica]